MNRNGNLSPVWRFFPFQKSPKICQEIGQIWKKLNFQYFIQIKDHNLIIVAVIFRFSIPYDVTFLHDIFTRYDKNILPGNSKSLWRAVNIAKDIDGDSLPLKMFFVNVQDKIGFTCLM